MRHQSKIDIAVLLIFFTRTEKTLSVFEEIRKARPSRLYLYQDGPRPNRADDLINIEACRRVVENIDWDCEVHRLYQTENKGCDPSEFIAQKWMFETESKGIILEDDDVPSQSFFPFCKELLDRYEHDDRINIICGMNNLDTADTDSSYIFTEYGSIWGWATWKRNVDRWDENYHWLNNKETVNNLRKKYRGFDTFINTCLRHIASGRQHYESILGAHQYINHQLNIVPAKNMITNIGIGSETTHSTDDIKNLPRAIRRLLFKERFEIEFPLRHPDTIVEDMEFKRKFNKLCHPGFLRRNLRRAERLMYMLFPILK